MTPPPPRTQAATLKVAACDAVCPGTFGGADVREWKRAEITFRVGRSWQAGGTSFYATKARRRDWNPAEHPRDARGRFVRKNARVRLLGGALGRVVGFDSSSRRFEVHRDDGVTARVMPAHMTVIDDKPAARPRPARRASTTATGGTATAVLPPSIGPKTKVSGELAIRPDLTTNYRKVIAEYDFEAPGNPEELRGAARAVREKKPLTAAQAEALGDALLAQKASAPPPRQRVLDRIAVRMDTVSHAIVGIHPGMLANQPDAKKIAPEEVKVGHVLAVPDRGGGAKYRRVMATKPFYGQYRMTLADKDGNTEERLVHPETDLYQVPLAALLHGQGDVSTGATGPKLKDLTLPPGSQPAALYDGPGGPGAVNSGQSWYDVLAASGKDTTAPIPVAGLTIEGDRIDDGIAQRRKGRSYLVERRYGESDDEMIDRIDSLAAMVEATMAPLPPDYDTKAVLRGVAMVEGRNPHDAFWEKKYGVKGFMSMATGGMGGITFWNGHDPAPTTIAHEFGHNVDTHLHGTGSYFSDQKTPVLTGQVGTWFEAIEADRASSGFYKGRFTQTRPGGHLITPGEEGPTTYGAKSVHEDFAESVRLWMKDRREGKLGYDPKSIPPGGTIGDDVRFADLYPARARILDLAFGAEPIPETPTQRKRKKELAADFDKLLETHNGNIMLGDGKDGGAAEETNAFGRGLVREDVEGQWIEALSRWADSQDKKAAAEKAAAEQKAKQEKAAKAAAEKVRTAQQAVAAGVMDSDEASLLTSKVNEYRKKIPESVPKDEAAQRVAAYEAELIAAHFGFGVDYTPLTPWLTARLQPGVKEGQRRKAKKFLEQAGKTVHPKADEQTDEAPQAKANIAAAIADRLNNPTDWEVFREYANTALDKDLPSFDDTSPEARHVYLAHEISKRVRAWANSAGDGHLESVLMQQAVKDEFGLDGPSAPNVSKTTFDEWMKEHWQHRGAWYRRVARRQYEHTQDELAAAGIKEVGLYRGMHFSPGTEPSWLFEGEGPADLSPVNAWTSLKSIANLSYFGSAGTGSGWMLEATVPRELVLGTARTGFGCLHEWEYVVMNNPGNLKMYRV